MKVFVVMDGFKVGVTPTTLINDDHFQTAAQVQASGHQFHHHQVRNVSCFIKVVTYG